MRVARVASAWLIIAAGFAPVSCRYGYEASADFDAPNGGREEDAEAGANDEAGGASEAGGRANAFQDTLDTGGEAIDTGGGVNAGGDTVDSGGQAGAIESDPPGGDPSVGGGPYAGGLGGSTGEPGNRGGAAGLSAGGTGEDPGGAGAPGARTDGPGTGEAQGTRTCGGRLESPTEPPSVTPSAQVHSSGASIQITFTGAQDWQDWIGIYFDGERPGRTASLFWFYINGSRKACKLVPSGTVVFDAANPGRNRGRWPPAPGNYRVFLLAEDAYEIRAQATFRIEERR